MEPHSEYIQKEIHNKFMREAAVKCFEIWIATLTPKEIEECLLYGTREPDLRYYYDRLYRNPGG